MTEEQEIAMKIARFLSGEIESVSDPYINEGLMLGAKMSPVVAGASEQSSFTITVEVPNRDYDEENPDDSPEVTEKTVAITVKVVQ